jgi:hypothetical protein
MTLQKRLRRLMRRLDWRVADLAREFERPYTTVREWVLFGRDPGDIEVEKQLKALERR